MLKFRLSAIWPLLAVALAVVALDIVTKEWAKSALDGRGTIPIIDGFLRLRYTENTGAAFGFFQGWGGALSIAAIAVVVAIVVSATRMGQGNRLVLLALGLITGGAIGNLIDRFRFGYVVDFVDAYGVRTEINDTIYSFPVFNFADSCITIGVILLIGISIFGMREEAEQGPVPAAKAVVHTNDRHSPWFKDSLYYSRNGSNGTKVPLPAGNYEETQPSGTGAIGRQG
jgi:signal peptidase II